MSAIELLAERDALLAEVQELRVWKAEVEKQEPVAWLVRHDQAQQLSCEIMKTEAEVAGFDMQEWHFNHGDDGVRIPAVISPLYAQPVPAPVLADLREKPSKQQIENLAGEIAVNVARNCASVPQLTFPHIYLGLLDFFGLSSKSFAESDAAIDAAHGVKNEH